jgi:three-Cys-motif partner protein
MAKHSDLGVDERFWDSPSDASRIKQKIVGDYFTSWTNVLARKNRIVGYADLFAGRGRYKNGEPSTPLIILERAINDGRLRATIKFWFNEGDPECAAQLLNNISSLPGLDRLTFQPKITKRVVDKSLANHRFSIPTLVFADPSGYKGLSLRLVHGFLQGFGNDCIFFFNYRRVNMKLSFPEMDGSIDEFFEADRAIGLREKIRDLNPREREKTVLEAIREAIRESNAIPVVFGFRSHEHGMTSHHLVFASKHQKGGEIMKRIRKDCSSDVERGIGSGYFDTDRPRAKNLPLFSPLDSLADRLVEVFADRQLKFEALLSEEAAHTDFTETNYRDALLQLEMELRIEVNPPAATRKMQSGNAKRTLPKESVLTFRP